MNARRLAAVGLTAALAFGILTGCAPAAIGTVEATVPVSVSTAKVSPPEVVVPQPAVIADRSGLLLLDPWAVVDAPVDDGSSVITNVASVTLPQGALAYAAPGGDVLGVLGPRTMDADTVLPVVETRFDGAWVRVQLASRLALPSSGSQINGATAWVSADEVTLALAGVSVVVDLTHRTLSVLDAAGTVTFTAPVAIGAEATPTPVGRGYLVSNVEGTKSTPRVMATSMHSGALDTYAGDPGVIGIHTVHGLATSGAVSNGCLRVSSDAVMDVVGALPAGTPITITNEGI